MAAKKTFIKQFIEQWNSYLGKKISQEYDKGRVSSTAKIFISAPSWVLKQMAEYEFDNAIETKLMGKRTLPKRISWVNEELLNWTNKKLFPTPERSQSPLGDKPSMLNESFKKDVAEQQETREAGNPITLIKLEAIPDLKHTNCKKCKRTHDENTACKKKVKTETRKTTNGRLARPLTSNERTGLRTERPRTSQKLTVLMPPPSPTKFSKRESSILASPRMAPRKRATVSFSYLQASIDKLLRPKLKLKTVFIAAWFIVKTQISVELSSGCTLLTLARRLKPKPRQLMKFKCSLSTEVLENLLGMYGARLARLNKNSKALV